MRYYAQYMLDGESYSPPTDPTPANYNIPFMSVIMNSSTDVTIVAGTPSLTPGSYAGAISTLSNFNAISDLDYHSLNDADGLINKSGLTPGQTYYIRLRAYSGANATGTYGEYIYDKFTMPKPGNVGTISTSVSSTLTPVSTTTSPDAVTSTTLNKILANEYANKANDDLSNATDSSSDSSVTATGSSYAVSGNREVQRSIFKITNKYKDRERYSIAEKNTQINTSYKKYAFGAGIFFDSATINPLSGGGIGFFTSNNGMNGYFVEIQTDSSNADNKDKSLKIFKVINGKKILLPDSQDTDESRLAGGIIHATQYKLDINVSVTSDATVIDVYVNNFKVSAADTKVAGTSDPVKNLISPTSNISLFSSLNTTNFDYVYAVPLSDDQNNNGITRSLYSGQYANSTLNFLYGEKIAQNFNAPVNKNGYLEEFGTVARELRYVKVNYAQPAAFPLYATTGVNKYATVLGSRFSNHGAEIFVINNAGTFIPLKSGQQDFAVIGNYVSVDAQHEYTETTTNEYTVLEPATFQSNWIQSESDAKSLFTWIKNQWSKQQQSIRMEVFGNPAIEVGDVITVKYLKNDLDGTKKFLVTNVNLSFEEGLSTSITARSIYS